MILLAGIVAGIVIGWLRGGKLTNLGTVQFQWAWVALAALAIQIALINVVPSWTEWARVFFPLTHAAILTVAWVNRDLAGLWLVAAGTALNLIAMLANGGFMPIAPETVVRAGIVDSTQSVELHTRLVSSKGLILPRDEITLWWLGDAIPLRPIKTIVSIGDVLVAPGVFLFVHRAMSQWED